MLFQKTVAASLPLSFYCLCFFSASESECWRAENANMLSKITSRVSNSKFSTTTSLNCSFASSDASSLLEVNSLVETWQILILNRSPGSPKWSENNVCLDISLFSISLFLQNYWFDHFIKKIFGNFSSVKGSFFEIPWLLRKRLCYCYFVGFQTQNSSKLFWDIKASINVKTPLKTYFMFSGFRE